MLLHTDAAQTIGKIPVDVQELNVDYLTIVGHKFYGPRIGILFAKKPIVRTFMILISYIFKQIKNAKFDRSTGKIPSIWAVTPNYYYLIFLWIYFVFRCILG